MNELEKLLRKISARERQRLLEAIEQILSDNMVRLDVKKLAGKKILRVRIGRFRILFSHDHTGAVVIHAIRLRNEETYR
jgi:mRNA-degrading endonuclease RelE of RelBE toxin-antitoxin system